MFDVFEPFEVRNSDTTSIAKDVREETDSLIKQDLFSISGCRTIGSFDDQFALEFVSVVSVYGLFESSRDEDIAEYLD